MVALGQHSVERNGRVGSPTKSMIPEWGSGTGQRGCMNPCLFAKAADLKQERRSAQATAAESIPCVISIIGVVGNVEGGVPRLCNVLSCLGARVHAVDVLSLPPSAPIGRQGTRGARRPCQRSVLVFSPGTKVLR